MDLLGGLGWGGLGLWASRVQNVDVKRCPKAGGFWVFLSICRFGVDSCRVLSRRELRLATGAKIEMIFWSSLGFRGLEASAPMQARLVVLIRLW